MIFAMVVLGAVLFVSVLVTLATRGQSLTAAVAGVCSSMILAGYLLLYLACLLAGVAPT